MEPLDAHGCARVDHALKDWRQGDCVVGERWLVFRTDLERPLTPDGAAAAAEGADTAESEVFGLMVLTQTCDLVRKSSERPFVEVCPLVEVDEAHNTGRSSGAADRTTRSSPRWLTGASSEISTV